jgi:aryl-alcohol dehydrogenase-like predicted oxidoreductase
MGHNEVLLREALRDHPREQIVLSVKFGAVRDPKGTWIGIDGRPAVVKNFLSHTLRRLGMDNVDIYRPGRVDPAVPIEETVDAIADMIKAGYVRHVGLSEAGADTVRRAHKVHPVNRSPDCVLADFARHRDRDSSEVP